MTTTATETVEVELAIGGTTRASCAARIEKKPKRTEGVDATVDHATEKAKIAHGADVTVTEPIATVAERSVRLPAGSERAGNDAEAAGRTALVVAWDGTARALEAADAIKESSPEALGRPRGLGLHPVLPTGDDKAVAQSVAAEAIHPARRTPGIIRGHLFRAFARNVCALPLVAAGLLNPLIAGAAMAFSPVSVIGGSLRLRRFRAAG